MKKGYRIVIQSDLSLAAKKVAQAYCDNFIELVGKECRFSNADYRGKSGGGYSSWFKRNTLGFVINNNNPKGVSLLKELFNESFEPIVFRRISKNKRIFGVVKLDELVYKKDNEPINISKLCLCPKCTDFKVCFKNGVPKTELYFEYGHVKG